MRLPPAAGRATAAAQRLASGASPPSRRRSRALRVLRCAPPLARWLLALAGLLLAATTQAQGPAQSPAHCPPDAQALAPAQIEAALREAASDDAALRDAVPGEADPHAMAQPDAGRPAAAPGGAPDRGFLWRIERDGRASYLYGTVHVARAAWLLPGPRVLAAFEASDTVALELDVLDADIQRRLAEGMRARPDEALPAALALRLQAQIAAQCLAPAPMARLSPMVQLAALTTLAARADGLDPAYAIDAFLAALARVGGKPVVSLESPEAQLALLRGDPRTAEERLDKGLAGLEGGSVRPMLLRVARLWDAGRADELERFEDWCDCAGTEAERAELKQLLDDRNPQLAERIAALHAGGASVFAAVGALHLFGAHALPRLLAARGFALRRVEFGPRVSGR